MRTLESTLLVTGLATMTLASGVGCLERKETITVTRDGHVHIKLEYEGDAQEFEGGDAMPTQAVTDTFSSKRKVEDNGDEVVTVEAGRRFEPGAALPSNFAPPGDPDADLYVQFPTSVSTTRTRNGTYYQFSRTYTARPWAYVNYWQELVLDDEVKSLTGKPVDELTPDERIDLIRDFATVEAMKQVAFAKEALRECAPDLPQRFGLMARQKLLHVFMPDEMLPMETSLNLDENEYLEAIVSDCDTRPADQRDACFEAEAEHVLALSLDAFVRSLREDAGFGAGGIAAFRASYDRAKRRYEITSLLGGHGWEVCAELPGSLVAHNGDSVELETKGGGCEVCWNFEGKAVRDRDVELMATSFVSTNAPGR